MTVCRPGLFVPGLLVAVALAWSPAGAANPVRHVRNRPGPASGIVPGRVPALRRQYARRPARSSSTSARTVSRRRGSVPVGLEPVAVAARTDGEVWVVNHLSDSVSVVDVAADPPRVVRTLLVGDEPRDIVFAGPGRSRAFVTAAHRGQNRPGDPQLTTPGVGRADVWVFDAGRTRRGTPTILTLFGDTPRALAVTPDGATVYAAVFHSGNQTTTITEGAVCDGGATAAPCDVGGIVVPGGLPAPNRNVQGLLGPETGLIVRHDPLTGAWSDPVGRDWREAVRFSLPDLDVFAIDAMAPTPVQTAAWPHVGTILFNLAVNPASGKVYVTNTEAHNEVRFEGPRHPRRLERARQPPPGPHHGARWCRCRAAASEQAHRLRRRAEPAGDEGTQPRHARRHGDRRGRQNALGRRLRFQRDRHLRHRGAGAGHVRSRRRRSHRGERRRTLRPGARRGARTPVRAHPLRQRREGGRHGRAARDRRASVALCGTGRGARGTSGAVRRAPHVEQRRGVVRRLSRLRRFRQPGLGPGQSRTATTW